MQTKKKLLNVCGHVCVCLWFVEVIHSLVYDLVCELKFVTFMTEFTWGTIPVLELSDHPGQMISQSMAIARFLAKRFDLVGGVCK